MLRLASYGKHHCSGWVHSVLRHPVLHRYIRPHMVKPMIALFCFGGAQGGLLWANPDLRRVVLCCNMLCCGATCCAVLQGGIGWLMVKSGLEKPKHEGQDIHVSPYRSARTAPRDCRTFLCCTHRRCLAHRWRTVATCVLPATPAAPHRIPLPHRRGGLLPPIGGAQQYCCNLRLTCAIHYLCRRRCVRALLKPDDTVYCTANRRGLGYPMMRSLTQSHAVTLCFWVGSAHPNEPHTVRLLHSHAHCEWSVYCSGSRRTCRARL
jgi:hypothetical protein